MRNLQLAAATLLIMSAVGSKTLAVLDIKPVERFLERGIQLDQIRVSPERAQYLIDFWARQMSEHALFLHLGLVDPELKARGLELHQLWEDFRNTYTVDAMDDVFPLLEDLRDYKKDVIDTLASGQWIGWLYPRFVQHILLELNYFNNKLTGRKFTPRDEVEFWNIVNGDHAAFASQLLDPTEQELIKKADAISKKFDNIVPSERAMMIKLSLIAGKELDEFNKTAQQASPGKIKSIIHPALLDHVIREGEESIKTLSKLRTPEAQRSLRTIRQEVGRTRMMMPAYQEVIEVR